MPMPIVKYAENMPAIYSPPICKIFFLVICKPKRNAMVMSKIENEHGWTLSNSAENATKGKSHMPPPLMLQRKAENPELYLSVTTIIIASKITLILIMSFFIV
jgi:hypothetical protein